MNMTLGHDAYPKANKLKGDGVDAQDRSPRRRSWEHCLDHDVFQRSLALGHDVYGIEERKRRIQPQRNGARAEI
jgi:hypothetical protein